MMPTQVCLGSGLVLQLSNLLKNTREHWGMELTTYVSNAAIFTNKFHESMCNNRMVSRRFLLCARLLDIQVKLYL